MRYPNQPNRRFWHEFVMPLLLRPMTRVEAEQEVADAPPGKPMSAAAVEQVVRYVRKRARKS